jgi:hypothetical protein
MSLINTLREDLISAQKAKDEIKVSTLRLVFASILNKEKEKRKNLSKTEKDQKVLEEKSKLAEEEIVEVINSEIKKRREALSLFEQAKRSELVESTKKEIAVLEKYLPAQLTEDEIKNLVRKAIVKVGAKDIKDMGKVMGALMPEIKGKADGTLVSKIVKDALSGL